MPILKLIVNFLVICFIVGVLVLALRFVCTAIGVGLGIIWSALPALLVVGGVWYLFFRKK